jgi:ribonuclease E
MTFTEAAVEVLRRAGKPLHFKEISEAAVRENLLSHVGQDPEVTMGQRLAAMAKREEERKVVAVAPEGTFALTEWGVPADLVVEPVAPLLHPAEDGEAQYRPREREPRPIHAQARKRMEVLQAEHEEGSEEVEAERRRAQGRPEKGQKRFPPPAEVVFEALAQRQSGAPLAELAQQLLSRQLLSDALVQDLSSLVTALLEDNRRRTEAGRKPAFIVDGERVTLVEFPPPAAVAELVERAPQTSLGRPMTGAQLVAEGRRAVVRALRRRLAELETAGFEQLCALLLQKMGMRDVRIAKRSKEGPLYLARQRRGVSDLRVAVKLVRGAREIGRTDVQELRKDLAHYSAQMGLVLAAGEAGREARSEASAAGQAPVALYAGDALPEEMIDLHVGVTVQLVEIPDVDEAFFAAAAKAQPGNPRDEKFRDEKFRDEKGRDEKGRDEKGRDEKGRDEKGRDDKPREERPRDRQRERHQDDDAAKPPEPVAAEPAASPAEAIAESAPAAEPSAQPDSALPPAAADAPAEAAQKEGRRPRRGREDRPRAMTPAEQAWGQPAGTLRMSHAAAAAPPEGEGAASADAARAANRGTADAASGDAAADASTSSTAASASDGDASSNAANVSATAVSASEPASNGGGDAAAPAASPPGASLAPSVPSGDAANQPSPEAAPAEPVPAPPAEGDASKAP